MSWYDDDNDVITVYCSWFKRHTRPCFMYIRANVSTASRCLSQWLVWLMSLMMMMMMMMMMTTTGAAGHWGQQRDIGKQWWSKAAFTPGHMLPDTSCIHLYLLVAVSVSCIGNKIVASLSPSVAAWIQRDTSRPWHKWVVIMLPRYSQHVSRTSNLYPATCVRHHRCIRIQVARPGHMLPGNMCPGVNAVNSTPGKHKHK